MYSYSTLCAQIIFELLRPLGERVSIRCCKRFSSCRGGVCSGVGAFGAFSAECGVVEGVSDFRGGGAHVGVSEN